MSEDRDFIKGRGAQLNVHNRFETMRYDASDSDGLDEPEEVGARTELIEVHPKKLLNKVPSPDIPMQWSMNPYQGCEHGCIYCYARVTHNYWGYGAGLDFERKIMYKANAAELLNKELRKKSWQAEPIMLSGNTDCYQPCERKLEITRSLLEVCLKFRQPVGIITKNTMLLRDLDLLKALAEHNLIQVVLSITTLDESIRKVLEPRTASAKKRVAAIEELTANNIPTMVMMAPLIPGLTSHEIPELLKTVSQAGAFSASYTMLRLNGQVADLFVDWVQQTFPDRANKILNQVAAAHGGQLGDNRFGARMRGEGHIAENIRDLFRLTKKKYFGAGTGPGFNTSAFQLPPEGQLRLF